MKDRTRYVPCTVLPGMFKSEFYVMVQDSSAFVDRSNVWVKNVPSQGEEVEGKVKAYLVDEGEGQDQALIELPGEPVVGGLRTWIQKSLLDPVQGLSTP